MIFINTRDYEGSNYTYECITHDTTWDGEETLVLKEYIQTFNGSISFIGYKIYSVKYFNKYFKLKDEVI